MQCLISFVYTLPSYERRTTSEKFKIQQEILRIQRDFNPQTLATQDGVLGHAATVTDV